MNWDTFLGMLRNYAQAALRKRRSYAPQVKHMLDLYAAALDQEDITDAERQKRMDVARSAAVREYGREDSEFSLTDGS